MNLGFASEYQGCNITTTASFVGTGLGGPGDLPGDDKVTFRAAVPGVRASVSFVTLPKEKSDIVFVLRPGDTILLTGGTRVLPYQGITWFVANSVARSR
jgi:hypothetical protein